MTEDTIAQIQDLSNKLNKEIPERHRAEITEAQQAYDQLLKSCDHQFPDGTSALDSGFFGTSCKICYLNDL